MGNFYNAWTSTPESQRPLAFGVYGSIARPTDIEYSDVEMYCIIKGKEIETPYEWSSGQWKVEVDGRSADVHLKWAG